MKSLYSITSSIGIPRTVYILWPNMVSKRLALDGNYPYYWICISNFQIRLPRSICHKYCAYNNKSMILSQEEIISVEVSEYLLEISHSRQTILSCVLLLICRRRLCILSFDVSINKYSIYFLYNPAYDHEKINTLSMIIRLIACVTRINLNLKLLYPPIIMEHFLFSPTYPSIYVFVTGACRM